MTAIIQLEHIQKAYFMGKEPVPVLKGITLQHFKKRICGTDGSLRFR